MFISEEVQFILLDCDFLFSAFYDFFQVLDFFVFLFCVELAGLVVWQIQLQLLFEGFVLLFHLLDFFAHIFDEFLAGVGPVGQLLLNLFVDFHISFELRNLLGQFCVLVQ